MDSNSGGQGHIRAAPGQSGFQEKEGGGACSASHPSCPFRSTHTHAAALDPDAAQILATALVFVWGMRLSAFLFFRVMKIGEDARFDERRDQCCRFSVFWILQGTWVMLISLPVLFVNGAEVPSPITVRPSRARAVWVSRMAMRVLGSVGRL